MSRYECYRRSGFQKANMRRVHFFSVVKCNVCKKCCVSNHLLYMMFKYFIQSYCCKIKNVCLSIQFDFHSIIINFNVFIESNRCKSILIGRFGSSYELFKAHLQITIAIWEIFLVGLYLDILVTISMFVSNLSDTKATNKSFLSEVVRFFNDH